MQKHLEEEETLLEDGTIETSVVESKEDNIASRYSDDKSDKSEITGIDST
jgi:hypothetical protein